MTITVVYPQHTARTAQYSIASFGSRLGLFTNNAPTENGQIHVCFNRTITVIPVAPYLTNKGECNMLYKIYRNVS